LKTLPVHDPTPFSWGPDTISSPQLVNILPPISARASHSINPLGSAKCVALMSPDKEQPGRCLSYLPRHLRHIRGHRRSYEVLLSCMHTLQSIGQIAPFVASRACSNHLQRLTAGVLARERSLTPMSRPFLLQSALRRPAFLTRWNLLEQSLLLKTARLTRHFVMSNAYITHLRSVCLRLFTLRTSSYSAHRAPISTYAVNADAPARLWPCQTQNKHGRTR
jgi:hypothetical protein